MRYIFIYDGDCGFCVNAVRGLQTQINPPAAYAAYSQLSLDQFGLTQDECQAASQWVDLETGHISSGYYAFKEALRVSPCGPWRMVASLMAFGPVGKLGARFYNVFASARTLNPRLLFAARSAIRTPVRQSDLEPRVVLAGPADVTVRSAMPGHDIACGCNAISFALAHSLLALSLLLWRWYTGELLGYGWGWQMYS